MTSKPSATNCPRLSLVWLMFSVVWYCMSCSVENTDGYVIRSLLVAIGHLYLRTVLVLPVQAFFLWCAAKDTSGGYCGGVPPLPIPNREVKPDRADGTAHPRESRSPPFYESPEDRNVFRVFSCL